MMVNERGFIPIVGLGYLISAFIILFALLLMWLFAKSLLVSTILLLVAGAFIWFGLNEKKNDSTKKFLLIGGLIMIVIALPIGIIQPFSIVGSATTYVNQPYTASISVTSSVQPDSDYSDGTVTYLAGQTIILDGAGKIVFSSPIQNLITNNYSYALNWTPNQVGDYAIVSAILEKHSTFNYSTGVWSAYSSDIQVGLEKIGVSVVSISAPVQPTFNFITFFGDLWTSIVSWFTGLFG